MVRVLLCHYFKSQKAFHDLYNPTTITASKELLFIATTGCTISVYSLSQSGFPELYQFPTMSKVVKLIYNDKGNYVATLESKQRRHSPSFARVYFNWFESQTGDAVRAVLAGHSIRGDLDGLETQFVAVELPTDYSVTSMNSCPATGNIVIAGHSELALFRLCTAKTEMGEDWTNCCDLEHLLDVVPGFKIKGIALCDCYLAMRSQLEVRVIKLVFGQEDNEPTRTELKPINNERNDTIDLLDELESLAEGKKSEQDNKYDIINDDCILWSFDKCSLETESSNVRQMKASALGITQSSLQQNHFLFPSVQKHPVYQDRTDEPKVVLGPVAEVDGHPVKLELAGLYGLGFGVAEVPSVQGITMLYRRFKAEQLVNDDIDSAELHTLQLLPTYTKGLHLNDQVKKFPLVPQHSDELSLCGMCCLVSGPKEGYIYDIFSNGKLLSCYKYTSDTKLVTATNNLLHAITNQGLETYTVRMYAAATEWVRKTGLQRNESRVQSASQFPPEKPGLRKSLDDPPVTCTNRVSESLDTTHTLSTTRTDNSKLSFPLTDSEQKSSTDCSESVNYSSVGKLFNRNLKRNSLSLTDTSSVTAINTVSLENAELCTASLPNEKLIEEKAVSTDLETDTGDKHDEPSSENEHGFMLGGSSHLKSPKTARKDSPVSGAIAVDVMHHVTASRKSSNLRWALPVHDIEFLKQWSPPADLDVCLIGMYPFVGLEHITASEDSVVLFTRAPQDSLLRSKSFRSKSQKRADTRTRETQQEWSVYVLQNMSAVQLYKTIMPLASRCQKHNLQAHHHLVCEQHLFLRSFCVKDHGQGGEEKQLEKLLCESAANLAHLYGGFKKNKNPESCTELYTMSGLSLREVVDKTWKSGQFGNGFVHYLDQKLFGSNESVIVSKATAKKIFRIYTKVKPCRVAEIVLMSSLGGFSPESAVDALQDLKKSAEDSSFFYRIRPLDNLVLAVLYLHLCEPEHAQSALFSVPKKELIEVVVTHNYLLHEDCKHLTPLTQLLRKHKPETFLDVLLSLHDRGHMMLDTILALLEVNKPDVRFNNQAVEFLEAILNDESRKDSFKVAAIKLCDIYIQRLVDRQPSRRRPAIKSPHQHLPKGNGHFGSRFLWLDKLPPFEGSIPTVKQCPYVIKGASSQPSPCSSPNLSAVKAATRRFTKYSPVSNATAIAHREKENCYCCCCMESLLKLQALLCSEFTTANLCEIVLAELQGKSFQGDLSIKLLCLPHIGHHVEALKELLSICPEISVYYGSQYFGTDIEKWSNLLQTLLENLREASSNQNEETDESTEILLQVLKGTLSRMASYASPSVLLSLLPDDGSLGFFLPYLEQSYNQRASGKLSNSLMCSHASNHAAFSL